MPNSNRSYILWTNDGVLMSANKTCAAVRNCVKCWPGECLRFDLSVFPSKGSSKTIKNLHWNWRGSCDEKNFRAALQREHDTDPKAKFRIVGYRTDID